MKWRIVQIAIAVGVVGLVALIAHNMRFETVEVPVPLRGEAARNPFYGAIRFSEELGAEASWERVFAPPRSDAVVMLSQWNWDLSRARRERIEKWVEAGGRLIVDNSMVGDSEEFERWSGIAELKKSEAGGEDAKPEKDAADDEDEDQDEASPVAAPEHDDESIVGQFVARDCRNLSEDGSHRQIRVCGVSRSRSLSSSRKLLWALRYDEQIHALRTAVGRGSVTVINATPFRYRRFLDGDHPLLFATMAQLHHSDLVLFFTEQSHASLLSLMWRFGAPAVLLIVACILLALWRSIPRFGPPEAATVTARRSLAEQIRGTGLFALRFGSGKALHAASVRALRDAAIRKFPGFDNMSSEERVAALARASGLSADDLGPALNHVGVRSPHELRNAIALLEAARRRLSTKKAKHGN
jgi:hypothetical protein